MAEVEHILQWSCDYVQRAISDAAEAPINLDEGKDGAMVRHAVIDEIALGVRWNHQKRQARALISPRLAWRSAAAASGSVPESRTLAKKKLP